MSSPSIEQVARETFGFDTLRPGQREAIESVLAGRDTLVVMSTGSGKSAIYEVAGYIRPGVTVVISPLIALQRDRVEAIEARVPGEAAGVNSNVAEGDRREAMEDFSEGEFEYLFLAPEQLANDEVLEQVRSAGPSLIVVDEAHCISEWGHDFRPDYLRLGAFVAEMGHPVVLALTATASPPVREEIVKRLNMHDPRVIVRGFDRANIWLGVERFHEEPPKRRALVAATKAADKPGLVYAATRKTAEELAEALEATAYHAGMSGKKRDEIQNDFMDDKTDVIVATTAFGMGIDKPNIRFVHHFDISESVDSYYQEIGRAGRDGEPARALLFYRSEDLGLRRFFAGGALGVDVIQAVADTIFEKPGPVEPTDLRDELDLSETRLSTAVSRLAEAGAVEPLPSGELAPGCDREQLEDAVQRAAEAEEERHAFDRSRVEMMRAYAEHPGCRRQFILSYFGEEYAGPCGNCDNCDAGLSDDSATDGPFAVGARVEHAEWGPGAVQRYDGDQMTVLFDSVGYKTLSVQLVVDGDLLTLSG
ncbi:MAG: ATP-dependent helicase RecQ [Thermoleophilaceae bacterium]|jgi:ATP-dependent DNA helicase RecQ|nr:ATP-dependent helicase RecQ [Thermoleophilaceae bacterium]